MEALLNHLEELGPTVLLVSILAGILIIIFLFDYREISAKKIPTFSAEPPYSSYKAIGDREILVEADSYQRGMYLLSKKAFKMGAHAIKDFKITTIKKGKDEKIMLSGLPIVKASQ